MAKTKRRTHRKHRVGATDLNPKNPLVLLAAAAVGFVAADQIYSAIDKAIPTTTVPATATTPAVVKNVVSDTVLGAGFAGTGAAIALMGKKTMAKTVLGGVLAGAGLKWILKDQGVISGFPSVPVIAGRNMRGFPSVPVIAGVPAALKGSGYTTSRMPALAGVPAALKGNNGYTTSRMPALAGAGLF